MTDKKQTMGQIGEIIIRTLLESVGRLVVIGDWWDLEKDFLIDGKRVEVKTQVPWVKEGAFTFKDDQSWKVMKADEVYFVAVPNKKYPSKFDGCVYKLDTSKKFRYYNKETSDGRVMKCVPIEQDAMEMIYKIDDQDILDQLMAASSSGWN